MTYIRLRHIILFLLMAVFVTPIRASIHTDYLLGGALTLKNGRIDKYQFDEGYCQAEKYPYNTRQDNFTFCYYDKDHLGNIRQVKEADGTKEGWLLQTMDYYPFGAQFCDGTTDSNVQSRKYNGKEFDQMHGLNTYAYGARQYNPVTGRWDRVDQLTEKNPNMTPFHFCHDNPMNRVDPDGRADYFSNTGKFISSDNNPKDPYIYIQNKAGNTKLADYNFGNDKKGLTAMMRIAFHYGKSVGATQKGTSVGVDAGMPAGTDSETLAYTDASEHHIRLMVKDGHFKDNMSQIFNMKSVLRHESYHDKGEYGRIDSEVKTLINEINHPEFNKTTDSFQKSTLKLLQDNLIILYEKSADSFDEQINQAKELLEKHGMNGTPNYHDGGNSISF